ncbi:KpsF/GutQ family sugar-phosphate isomerase [Stygiobacter electus]|uniref:KpsF/GutQ family sugar-phosphate isomerase n=1 Tax=Stygiobacter electus TaxID=3032292 RepID=A0AAE3P1V9_9BACT|nr:KpsF/GutQ family sugar-phosphate isomerase [Stygiobacter electus]MDF1612867.1 KpsF/GutQ family sugar-phosphate isomerase [Stygiobacter electus]
MNYSEIISLGKKVIKIESEAVESLINKLDENFAKAVELILNSKGRVVYTGMGKSGLIARKIVATMNSTGTAAIYMHPTDALHGDLGMVRKDDIVILISKSGYTEELINLVPLFKRINVPIIGMIGDENSKLAKDCDVILDVSVKEEACPFDLAPTSSTTAALVMGDALAISLLELRGFTAEDFALLHPGGSLGKRLALKISEIMYSGKDVPIVYEDTSLKDTILEITSKRLGTTCVVNEKGKLTGIITDGDLRRLLEKTIDIKELKALDVMTKNPKTISQDLLASFALQMMEQFNITSLIVVDKEKYPIGMVHLHDLVKLGLRER